MAREAAQALTIGARYAKPANFGGTLTAWRALCEVYPSAETPEVIMAVIEYCTVRNLDPYKRPVHVVPMWNQRLRRKVQVVMQGINEVEITASRTGKWAGMDEAKWGPAFERTFRGSFERDNGTTESTEVTMRFPEWCSVTVYRLVGDQRAAFTETLWWEESYGRAGFRSEVPNARWQQAPRQMLHKCYSPETEVLTETGFHRFADVPAGTRIMQVTPLGLEAVKATPFRQDYAGPMIVARGTGLNFRVTPDHSMILDDGSRIDAGEMFAATRVRPKFRLPLHPPASRSDAPISDAAIRLSAWYLTDGTDRHGGKRFVVSVSRQRKIEALSAIDARVRVRSRRCAGDVAMLGEQAVITRSDKREFEFWLADCEGLIAPGKVINHRLLIGLSQRQARLFVETMMHGDGSITDNGTRRYHASHDRILKAFELACVLAGWSVSQRTPRRVPTGQMGFTVTVGRRPVAPVRLLSPSAPQADRVGTDDGWYAGLEMVGNPSGEVWCVTVPSGAIVVRLDGQSMICGNCTKAAVLRAAFPEEGLDYTAEEMDGHETEGGLIIDGVAEPDARARGHEGISSTPPPIDSALTPENTREAARERQSEVYADPPKPAAIERLEQAPSASVWLLALERGAQEAASTEELSAIATHPAVRDALANYPTLIQARIRDALRLAHERLAPQEDEQFDAPDPLADLFAEIEAMDLTTLAGLPDNAAWRAKTADLFPTDADRIDEAVTERKARLTQQQHGSAPSDGTPTGETEATTRDEHSPTPPDAGP